MNDHWKDVKNKWNQGMSNDRNQLEMIQPNKIEITRNYLNSSEITWNPIENQSKQIGNQWKSTIFLEDQSEPSVYHWELIGNKRESFEKRLEPSWKSTKIDQ